MRRNGDRFARTSQLVVVLLGASMTRCTTGGLDALGAGSHDAATGSTDAGTAAVDSSTSDVVTSVDAAVDEAGDAAAEAATSGNDDATTPEEAGGDAEPLEAAAPEAEASTAPGTALPVYPDAGTPTWCDQHTQYTFFCADFDKGPLPAGFAAEDGSFLYQTSSSPAPNSPSNGLLLWVPTQAGAGSWGSKLSKPFAIEGTTITLEFDVNPSSQNPTTSGLLFAGMDFAGNSAAKYSIRLAYSNGQPRLEESYLGTGGQDIYHAFFTLPPDTWSRVQVALQFAPIDGGVDGGMTGTETVTVQGVQGATEALTPPAGFDRRPTLLIGGVYGTSPNNAWVIRYDDVTFDIR